MVEGRYSIMSHEASDADEVPSIPVSIGKAGVSTLGKGKGEKRALI